MLWEGGKSTTYVVTYEVSVREVPGGQQEQMAATAAQFVRQPGQTPAAGSFTSCLKVHYVRSTNLQILHP